MAPNAMLLKMTLGQGHGKVIQYIFPDLYILCLKYLRFGSNGLMWGAKVFAAADMAVAAAVDVSEMNWKHKSTQTGVT